MRNPLQDQLLKAGLVKKAQVTQVAREQAKQRHAKTPHAPSVEQVEAERVRAERAERDRALAAERNAQARLHEQRAQIRQIIDVHRVPREGELEYRFTDGGKIRSVLVNRALRAQLASGALVIVRLDEGVELVPRAAAEKIRARDAAAIVLDHARSPEAPIDAPDAEYYARFPVPDDLVW